jgi:PST family polysaccharide transporter
VLGPEYFGLLAFATATVTYFILITDYGFNLSASRQISIHREDSEKINQIFSSVMIIKIALLIFSAIAVGMTTLFIDKFRENWMLYWVVFGMVIGQVLFPTWLFQGLERMKYIAYLNIGSKTIFTICIFIFVETKEDYLLVPFYNSLGLIISGLLAQYIVLNNLKIYFKRQKWDSIKYQIANGWYIFISTISSSVYNVSVTFILGIFTSNIVVGYFAAASKLIEASKGVYGPVLQALYPYIGKLIKNDKQKGLEFINLVTRRLGGLTFIISIILIIFSEFIVNLILGPKYQESVLLFAIMAPLPFLISLSNIFGIQTMLNLGCGRDFSIIIILAAAISIVLSFIFIPTYGALASSVIMVIVELLIVIAMILYLKIKIKII